MEENHFLFVNIFILVAGFTAPKCPTVPLNNMPNDTSNTDTGNKRQ